MAYDTLIVEAHDAVTLIRLNRPEALNALKGVPEVLHAGLLQGMVGYYPASGNNRAIASVSQYRLLLNSRGARCCAQEEPEV